MSELLAAALELAAAGCSVIPIATDGTKRPAIAWKTHTTHPADTTQIHTWFDTPTYDGLGVVCGTVSGNLEMLEAEKAAVDAGLVENLHTLLDDHDPTLWPLLCTWTQRSPSGGIHWLYRVTGAPVAGNTKLARRPNLDNPQLVDVLFETRGEGGQFVAAPSTGRTHPTGASWRRIAGSPAACPTITADQRDLLHALARRLDQMPTLEGPTRTPGPQLLGEDGLRPGDDFNARATWEDILTPHDWTRAKRVAGGYGWTRPDKRAADGISATTGTSTDGVDRLYVFTTSTTFEPDRPYTKFGALAHLEHGGDHAAAARALRTAGYGTPPAQPVDVRDLIDDTPSTPPAQPVDVRDLIDDTPSTTPATTSTLGNLATVHQLPPRPAPNSARTVADSEDAHAHRLIGSYGDLVRYCPERGRWLVWNGSRWVWQPPGGGTVREYAKKVARLLTDHDANLTQRRRALSSAGISGCLKQAETDERVAVAIADLDADPWTLNTPAGAIDLRTGIAATPNPASLCTKTTHVAPASQPDPLWEAFLADTFGGDHELRAYVQRLVGLTLLGKVREQLLAFLHGAGANGKSTLAETLMHALGVGETGYAIAAPAEMLMIRKHSEHPAELAQLAGARMVVCSELDDGQRFAEAKIKQLTGRDSINARFLYGQPFTFTPTHTIWLLGNQKPQARTGGMAFWRRVKLIEFAHVVPTHKRDPALGDKLNNAAPTVLKWAIEGCVDYLAGGIREPVSVSAAVQAYASDQDTIGRFVEEACRRVETDEVQVLAAQLRAAYESWCHENGEEPVSAKRLGQELRDRFKVGEKRSNGRRFYTRICLFQPEQSDTVEDPEAQDRGWYR